MEELILAAIIGWVINKQLDKKASQTAPNLPGPPQQRANRSRQQMPNFNPQGNPGAPSSGPVVTSGPQGNSLNPGNSSYGSSSLKKFV